MERNEALGIDNFLHLFLNLDLYSNLSAFVEIFVQMLPTTLFGWLWLVLICYERKILLAGCDWWPVLV